jgi:predicted nucleic acid-binding protein
MALVIDSSFLLAALVERGTLGEWARDVLSGQTPEQLFAPYLLQAEVVSVLRKKIRSGDLVENEAGTALGTLSNLPIRQIPLVGWLLSRTWELRNYVSPYDAWYIAAAEYLRAPLATCGRRLTQSTGPRCPFLTMPLGTQAV